jgi:glutamate carboxypeptidase
MSERMRAIAVAALLLGTPGIAAAAEANKPILDSAERQQPDAMKLWERLVNIDSGTGDTDGVNAVGAVAVEQLNKLGAAIEAIPAMPAYGNNIVARLSGTGKGKVLLIAHMDTVFPKGTAAARPFRVEATALTGRACPTTRPASSSHCRC